MELKLSSHRVKDNFKIFTDFDGVLTTKRKLWNEWSPQETALSKLSRKLGISKDARSSHLVKKLSVSKEVCDHDSFAVSVIKDSLIIISGDDRINKAWAKRQGVPFIDTSAIKHQEKLVFLEEYCKKNNISEFAYIGDSVPDLNCLLKAKYPFIPNDASYLLKYSLDRSNKNYIKLDCNGGHGCLDEAIYHLIMQGQIYVK